MILTNHRLILQYFKVIGHIVFPAFADREGYLSDENAGNRPLAKTLVGTYNDIYIFFFLIFLFLYGPFHQTHTKHLQGTTHAGICS